MANRVRRLPARFCEPNFASEDEVKEALSERKRKKSIVYIFDCCLPHAAECSSLYPAKAILQQRIFKDGRRFFQIDWEDGSTPTWEPEQNCSAKLIGEWEKIASTRYTPLPLGLTLCLISWADLLGTALVPFGRCRP